MTFAHFANLWHDASLFIEAHTSGSTGAPKTIRLLKQDMATSARATCDFFCITSTSRIHCPLSPDYIAAKMMYVRAAVSGATLTVESPSATPLAALSDVETPIDLLPIVPYQLPGLLASPHLHLVRAVIIGGAPLQPAMISLLRGAPFQAYATYGMTETASHVALSPLGEDADGLFNALPGYSFSTDARGCLVINNPSMSWCQVVTNDLVELTSPETFRWIGRFDNIINSGGIKLAPEKLEAELSASTTILPEGSFYITSRPSDTLGSEVVLVVDPTLVPQAAEDDFAPQLLATMRRTMPRHHAPRALLLLPILRTPSGKILRQKF